jgi:hypothetical protein
LVKKLTSFTKYNIFLFQKQKALAYMAFLCVRSIIKINLTKKLLCFINNNVLISITNGVSLHGFSLRQVDVFVLDVVQVGDKLERESKNLCYFLN